MVNHDTQPSNPGTPAYIGIDVETNGLNTGPVDQGGSVLLEIAVVLFDKAFRVIDHEALLVRPEGCESADDVNILAENSSDKVREMHESDNLWFDLRSAYSGNGGFMCAIGQADQGIAEMLYRHNVTPDNPLPLLGSSPNLDRAIVARDLPKVSACLRYKTLDASSFKLALDTTYGHEGEGDEIIAGLQDSVLDQVSDLVGRQDAETQGNKHRALFDVLASARQIPPIIKRLGALALDDNQ